ncbi:MAG: sigma-54-dependent Fis family transcriptional regulator [Desulfobacterales bacterium]|nr:sigma-54-dependent Fis family transcriptional regulator [Desulfobacterales bacterium]
MSNVLIIDDEKVVCDALSAMTERLGYDVTSVLALNDGVREASTGRFDVVFLDVRMPDGNGLDALPEILSAPSAPEVIIMTGFGDPDGAELAIKSGAWDYIEKPFSMEKFTLPLIRALEYRKAKKSGMSLAAPTLRSIVGSSPQMKTCLNLLVRAASSDASVLITGETGTGKELFARAIHDNSRRSNKNFVVVDCAALPETLVQSVLFGHEKGAFTGADRVQIGLIKQAHGGTLFLDEVGEIPMSVQKAFLRVLQERRFRPVGSKREVKSDFRLVVATNRDLDQMTQAGQFRKDLLFRLQSITVELPTLGERREDIKELALYHLIKLYKRSGTGTKGFSPEFFEALTAYEWPGNVRELINTLEGALAAAGDSPILYPRHLPVQMRIRVVRNSVSQGPLTGQEAPDKGSPEESNSHSRPLPALRDLRESMERRYFQDLISLTDGNIKDACQISCLSRARLYELLKKYKVTRPG